MLLARVGYNLNMEQKIKYRTDKENEKSILIDAATGSLFWSLTGMNLQFTWFDVPSKTNFPSHTHESEQITYVLEGELYFETQDTIFKLSKGDCILIPGNTIHRVWTENIPAKAVDAWAPVNNKYST